MWYNKRKGAEKKYLCLFVLILLQQAIICVPRFFEAVEFVIA